MVESMSVEHIGHHGLDDVRLYSPGVDGQRWRVICPPRRPSMRVTITGIMEPPPFIEMPFVSRDRFTLAALLPKQEEDDDYTDGDAGGDW